MLKGSRYELKIRRTPREIKMTTVLFLICSNLKIRRTYNRTRCADVDINISTLNVINYFGFMCSALECITFEEKKVITAERMQNIYSRAFYQKVACFAWINQQVLLLSSKLQGFLCKKKKKYIVFNQNALTTFFFSKHNWPMYEMDFFFYPSSVKRQKLERKNVLFPKIALSEIAFCFYTNAKCINILILTLISSSNVHLYVAFLSGFDIYCKFRLLENRL